MMPDEKDRLLTFLSDPGKWCRNAEARGMDGAAVHYDNPAAVAWDVTGALCLLFGWPRALFEQLDRHVHGKAVKPAWPPGDTAVDAMVALQEFNDHAGTTFECLREQWSRRRSGADRSR